MVILKHCASLCANVDTIIPNHIEILQAVNKHNTAVVLTRDQCCCLLSLAFFNLIPLQYNNTLFNIHSDTTFTFKAWYDQPEYLKCLFAYFSVMFKNRKSNSNLNVIFQRTVQNNIKQNDILTKFSKVELKHDVKAEYHSIRGVIQGICTNKTFGINLLQNNIILTDVRFIISPECLLTFLLCEPLQDNANECIHIKGIDFYSLTSTSGNFTFRGVYNRESNVVKKDTVSWLINPSDLNSDVVSALDYEVVIYQPKINTTLDTKIVEDIHRFSSVFQSSMGKKYVFNCCICGDSKFKVNAQLRFIEQWITASFFKINIMCCINNKNKKFKKLQEFIDTVKNLNIVEIM